MEKFQGKYTCICDIITDTTECRIVLGGSYLSLKIIARCLWWCDLTIISDIHFQYNGFLYGILLLSILRILQVCTSNVLALIFGNKPA